MKALLFTTDPETGYAVVARVLFANNETLPCEMKVMERAPGTSADYHNPATGKTFIVSILRGQLSFTSRAANGPESVTVGEGQEHHTAIFQDWVPSAELVANSGHKSAVVGDVPVTQMVNVVEGTHVPITPET